MQSQVPELTRAIEISLAEIDGAAQQLHPGSAGCSVGPPAAAAPYETVLIARRVRKEYGYDQNVTDLRRMHEPASVLPRDAMLEDPGADLPETLTGMAALLQRIVEQEATRADAREAEYEVRLAEMERSFAERILGIEQEAASRMAVLDASRSPEHDEQETGESLLKSPVYLNLNCMAIATWKSTCWPRNMQWDHAAKTFKNMENDSEHSQERSHLAYWAPVASWTFWLCIFPCVFLVVFIVVLAGILDEGLNKRTSVNGDWFYSSPNWRLAVTAQLRSKNFSDQGILTGRPTDEIDGCLAPDFLLPFAEYNATSGDYSLFWERVMQLQQRNGDRNNRRFDWYGALPDACVLHARTRAGCARTRTRTHRARTGCIHRVHRTIACVVTLSLIEPRTDLSAGHSPIACRGRYPAPFSPSHRRVAARSDGVMW